MSSRRSGNYQRSSGGNQSNRFEDGHDSRSQEFQSAQSAPESEGEDFDDDSSNDYETLDHFGDIDLNCDQNSNRPPENRDTQDFGEFLQRQHQEMPRGYEERPDPPAHQTRASMDCEDFTSEDFSSTFSETGDGNRYYDTVSGEGNFLNDRCRGRQYQQRSSGDYAQGNYQSRRSQSDSQYHHSRFQSNYHGPHRSSGPPSNEHTSSRSPRQDYYGSEYQRLPRQSGNSRRTSYPKDEEGCEHRPHRRPRQDYHDRERQRPHRQSGSSRRANYSEDEEGYEHGPRQGYYNSENQHPPRQFGNSRRTADPEDELGYVPTYHRSPTSPGDDSDPNDDRDSRRPLREQRPRRSSTRQMDLQRREEAVEVRKVAASAIQSFCDKTWKCPMTMIVQTVLEPDEYKDLRSAVNVKTRGVFEKLDYVSSAPLVAILFKSLAIQAASESEHVAVDGQLPLETTLRSLANEVKEVFEKADSAMGLIRAIVVTIPDNIRKALLQVRDVLMADNEGERRRAVSHLERARIDIFNASKRCGDEAKSINVAFVDSTKKINDLTDFAINSCANQSRESRQLRQQISILKKELKDYDNEIEEIDLSISLANNELENTQGIIEKLQKQLDQKQQDRTKIFYDLVETDQREGKTRWKQKQASGEEEERNRKRRKEHSQQIARLKAELEEEEKKAGLLRMNEMTGQTRKPNNSRQSEEFVYRKCKAEEVVRLAAGEAVSALKRDNFSRDQRNDVLNKLKRVMVLASDSESQMHSAAGPLLNRISRTIDFLRRSRHGRYKNPWQRLFTTGKEGPVERANRRYACELLSSGVEIYDEESAEDERRLRQKFERDQEKAKRRREREHLERLAEERRASAMVQAAVAKMKRLADEIEKKENEYKMVEMQMEQARSDEIVQARRESEEREKHYDDLDQNLAKEVAALQSQIAGQQEVLKRFVRKSDEAQKEMRKVKEAAFEKAMRIRTHETETNGEAAFLKFAQQAVAQLGHFGKEWSTIKDLFGKVVCLIEVNFVNDAKAFQKDYEGVRESVTKGSYAEAVNLEKKINELIRTILQLQLMINDIITVTEVYMEVSEKYVTPVLSGLCRYFVLTPEQAQVELLQLESEKEIVKGEVQKITEKGKKTRDPSYLPIADF